LGGDEQAIKSLDESSKYLIDHITKSERNVQGQ
jgi:hypothetical protein